MVLSGKEDRIRASIEVISYFTLGQVTNILYFVKIRYERNKNVLLIRTYSPLLIENKADPVA